MSGGLLRIVGMAFGGAGMGRLVDPIGPVGEPVAVPFVLPGELVRLGPGHGLSSVEVVEASAERVEPGCRHFGVCGGCQLQHAAYGEQVRVKVGILRGLLDEAGVRGLPEVEVHTGAAWGYRNRVRMRVEVRGHGLRVGYSARGGDAGGVPGFVEITECPIAAGVLWRAAVGFMRVGGRLLEGAAGARWMRAVVEVEFFTAEAAEEGGARLQMTVVVRGAEGGRRGAEVVGEREFGEFCEGVRGEVPELVGAGVMVLPPERPGAGPRAAQVGWAGLAWGKVGMTYEVGGRSYWVSRVGFFQGNRFLVGELVRMVTEGRRGELAWDLYAGVGLFSRALAEGFGRVVAVEAGEVAAGDLDGMARGMAKVGLRVEARGMTVVEFLRGAVVERERPGLVVMDPPRAGVGREVCGLLGRVGTDEMVYVSCDPRTLSRDVRAMVDSGYNLAELHLVDLFPQTFHMETVAVLRR